MRSGIGLSLLGIVLATGVAAAQSAPSTPTTPSSAATQPTTSSPSTAASTGGAFDKLSPGNKKIAQALCDAQPSGCAPSSLDQIAAMKQHKGWGEIFKEMKANGRISPDVNNLGELVSGKNQARSGSSGGTALSTGSGKSEEAGSNRPSGLGGHGGGRGR